MSSKSKTKTTQTNTLPDWLTSPYQASLGQATAAAAQPAISTGTQGAIDRSLKTADTIANLGNQTTGMLSGLAQGNFGPKSQALTDAASGQYLNSNPFAQNGRPTVFGADGGLNLDYIANSGLNATANGQGPTNPFNQQIGVSGALNGFLNGGGLDTSYLSNSGLNKTAAGDYLSADSNPYIRKVAQQGGDQAQAAINAQFGNAGRSNGSGLYAQLFGEGIANATNSVYAQNYANERQLQQGAQSSLLGAEAAAREAALGRQYGAAGQQFGAENAAAENAAQRGFTGFENEAARRQGAQSTLLGAQQSARENALGRQSNALESAMGRQASAYESERGRQQLAAGGLLDTQLQAAGQIPSILSSILSGNNAALAAGQYGDNAELNQQALYQGILSQIAAPYGMSNSTTTQKTGGLGSILGSVAQLGGAAASLFAPGIGSLAGAGLGALAGSNFPSAPIPTSVKRWG